MPPWAARTGCWAHWKVPPTPGARSRTGRKTATPSSISWTGCGTSSPSHFPHGAANYQLVESRATRAAVMTEIATHSWVHLACHASQQQADPAQSGFALWRAALTIADLAGQPTRGRDLAFLSACQTAT